MVELDEADFEDPEDLANEETEAAEGLELEGLDETVEAEDEPAEAEDEPAEATGEMVTTDEEVADVGAPTTETDTLASELDEALLEVDGFTTTDELEVPVQVPKSGLQPVLQ
jgi:hypothetical protein